MKHYTRMNVNELPLYPAAWINVTNNIELEKTDTKEYILYDAIYIIVKTRQN